MTDAVWRRSSYSGENGNCLEIREDLCAVRDSKNPTAVLETTPEALARFMRAVMVGRVRTR